MFTPTQGRYLSFIDAFINGFGYPPSEIEIAAALKVSPPSVNQMMKMLERKSLIRRERGVARSIEILVPPDEIPTWTELVTTTQQGWRRVAPNTNLNRAGSSETVYRFKITLQDTDPVIWRRIETTNCTLGKLHELIQTSMGWMNSHLHCFVIGDIRYSSQRPIGFSLEDLGETDYAGVRVSDLVSEYGDQLRLNYEYDYGDCWQHTVELEKVIEDQPSGRYPRCLAGDRACPPENIGGVWGFENFMAAITNPAHEQHDELLEWNGPFDPTGFIAEEATQRMKNGLPGW